MRIYIVDNGGQWTHREWRVVRNLGAESTIIPNDTPSYRISDADGIVLSGGAPSITDAMYIDAAATPVGPFPEEIPSSIDFLTISSLYVQLFHLTRGWKNADETIC